MVVRGKLVAVPQGLAHLFSHRLNLCPGWRNEQRGFALLYGGQIRIGGVLVKGLRTATVVFGGNFRHSTKFNLLKPGRSETQRQASLTVAKRMTGIILIRKSRRQSLNLIRNIPALRRVKPP